MEMKSSQLGYGDTQAFLAVPTMIVDKVLKEGYVCTDRRRVPVTLAHDSVGAVRAMRQYHQDVSDTVVLEVHGVPDDMIDFQESKLNTDHLDPKYIRNGIFKARDASQYPDKGCPICGDLIPELAHERGQVGLARFVGAAFMVSPCKKASCIQHQQARQERLDATEELTLYHQTNSTFAQSIKLGGGKICRGNSGDAGGGAYFATSARGTEHKTEHHGVVLECKVKLGKSKHIDQADKNPTVHSFAELIKEDFDSVIVDRGLCPSGPHKDQPSGDEYVVYSWDQVQVLREVPRDPCPCSACQKRADKP